MISLNEAMDNFMIKMDNKVFDRLHYGLKEHITKYKPKDLAIFVLINGAMEIAQRQFPSEAFLYVYLRTIDEAQRLKMDKDYEEYKLIRKITVALLKKHGIPLDEKMRKMVDHPPKEIYTIKGE